MGFWSRLFLGASESVTNADSGVAELPRAKHPVPEPTPSVLKWVNELLRDQSAFGGLSTDDQNIIEGLSDSDAEYVVEQIVITLVKQPLQYWELVICHLVIQYLGGRAATALSTLTPFLKHDSESWRRSTIHAIGDIGPAASAVLPDLRRCLDDNADSVRAAAKQAIKRLG